MNFSFPKETIPTKHLTEKRAHFFSSILPAALLGLGSGVAAALAVTVYKLFAHHTVELSHHFYDFCRAALWTIPAVIGGLLLVALLLGRLYRNNPDLQGGGIPSSVGTLRGIFRFHWLKAMAGTFLLSLLSFLLGLPLGTEGPSVQMGTAAGSGIVHALPKKWRAWERYAMTGGACSGFAVATGAPVSGILFAVEEAHQKVSPLILVTALTSVLGGFLTSSLLSPLLGVEVALFSLEQFPALDMAQLWLPLVVGLAAGLFALVFLQVYKLLHRLFRRVWKKVPHFWKLFGVMTLAFCLCLACGSFGSTGHGLILSYFASMPSLWLLLAILAVRTVVTLSANISGLTGGIFLPILAIGATLAALLGEGMVALGLPAESFSVVLSLGIAASVAGLMKMPLTAILFGLEALGLSANLLPLLLCVVLAYAIPEACGAASIGDRVLESREEKLNGDKPEQLSETEITVEAGSFAEGKAVQDILWPYGVKVLSVRRWDYHSTIFREGDRLLVRYQTVDPEKAREEMLALVKSRT